MASSTECANPLLLQWIGEWLERARQQGSKGTTVYKKAYDSMKACPIAFDHPSQAQQLQGLGPKLCDRLTDKLKAYCNEHGLPMPEVRRAGRKRPSTNGEDVSPSPPKKKRKQKAYVPALRSGGYAIILALATLGEDSSDALTKNEIINLAQPFCDSSFTVTEPGKFYTAWNSMKTLEEKDMVYSKRRCQYLLSQEGWEVAKKFQALGHGIDSSGPRENVRLQRRPATLRDEIASGRPNNGLPLCGIESSGQRLTFHDQAVDPWDTGDFIPLDEGTASPVARRGTAPTDRQPASKNMSTLTLPPGSFTVHLVLDSREIQAKNHRDYMQDELKKKGIKTITRALELGDFMWVAKCHDPMALANVDEEGDEIVLDYIVERKRLDDLVSSIKDGRFHEQKFRLRKSGLRNVIYIVEHMTMSADYTTRYQDAVDSAIASTQVVNGFFVKRTPNCDATIGYLARMTALLKARYEPLPLRLTPTAALPPDMAAFAKNNADSHMTYPAFAALTSKSDSLTLRDVFLKMLLCTRGVTADRALDIQRRWRTPREFVDAFEACGEGKAGRRAREDLVWGRLGAVPGRSQVGKGLSKRIAGIWGGVEVE